MTKHTPAASLPWSCANSAAVQLSADSSGVNVRRVIAEGMFQQGDYENAAYIAHAANAYPALVEALRAEVEIDQRPRTREEANAVRQRTIDLLRSLGEDA